MSSIFAYKKTDTLLKIENVCLEFDGVPVLKDVNIEIKDIVRPDKIQGQIVSLLAPSGMGKTQLFEIMAGLKKPTSGSVSIGTQVGDKINLNPVRIGEIGVVAQNYPLFDYMTVEANLMCAAKKNLKILKDNRNEKVESILTMFNLIEHRKKYPAILSGGQKQRVAIAQQLLCSDSFLLLDEPFSGLDPIMIKKVSQMILKIANSSELNTIIIVTHDIRTAALISDTLWVMGRDKDEKGNIIPGAKIKYVYDLIERGLAWREDIQYTPEFIELVKEVESVFDIL
jgi:polar amino acid transport system ATP-binding protein/sulfate transport system ATP-binding protein